LSPGLWLANTLISHSIVSATASFDVRRRVRDAREQAPELLARGLEETAVAGDAHDRLGDAEGDDLRVCDDAAGVSWRFAQEIVSRAINGGAEKVEVGVHRGLSGRRRGLWDRRLRPLSTKPRVAA
jgi:hypothetical protein